MGPTTEPKTLPELVRELGHSLAWLAEQSGLGYWALYAREGKCPKIGRIAKGEATPQEIDTLAKCLRIGRDEVESAMREGARRYGSAA